MIKTIGTIGIAIAAAMAPLAAISQSFPSRPVKLVVPASAGGVTDIVARALAQELGSVWSQPTIVENRPGASQIIGAESVAKSSPDGHTLIVSDGSAFVINPHLYRKLPYDTLRDFTAIASICQVAPVLAVSASLPATTVGELIAHTKAKAGGLSYGSVGAGSYMHIAMEDFKRRTGTDLVHVPYKGSTPAVNALLAGEIATILVHIGTLEQHAKAGKVRLLALATAQRIASHPNLPTIAESGVPGFETSTWFGVLGPSGIPREVVKQIHETMAKLIASHGFRSQYLARFALEPLNLSVEQFNDLMKSDLERWGPLVKASGATVD
ncbi:MAG: Bug family tripartite tricarboxylate transporter substrate binding protein [Burkholderiales bacterium]